MDNDRPSTNIYAFPAVGRAGLGNLLFPWARAEVFARQHGLPVLAPQWTQPKIGPLLRREKDLRYYTGLFSNAGCVRGLRRWWIAYRAEHVSEELGPRALRNPPQRRPRAVVFSGEGAWFEPLHAHREFVARRLIEILSGSTRNQLDVSTDRTPYVAAHVRRGDMKTLAHREPFPLGHWAHTPSIEWFVGAVHAVREAAGTAIPIKVFSDGTDEQLRPLLSLPGVHRAAPNPSVVDILLLSRARAVITSGSSSFSSWGVFLGGLPSLWYPQLRKDLVYGKPQYSIETDYDGRFDAASADALREALQVAPGPTSTHTPAPSGR